MGMVARDPHTAASALERLGGLLRHGLRVQRQDGEVVPLSNELELVDDYLALERLRLGERLRASVRTDPRILDEDVPAFVLQPLVENAVRHGVAPRAAGGRLEVTVTAEDGMLRLRVEDDGPGSGTSGTDGEGLGLRLIRERLAALYGDGAWLRAGAAPGGGFVAEVAIPRRRDPDEEGTA
jgi:LytS/YehU family sensor histidine kinase